MAQIVLVPFRNPRELRHTLDPALEAARRLSAEAVVLLRVNLPHCPETKAIDNERLYSELRGLQTQVADRQMPIHLDAMPGPMESAIMRYAEENEVGIFKSAQRQPTA